MPLTKEDLNVIAPHVDRPMSHDEYLDMLIFDNNGYDYGAIMHYSKENDERLNCFINSMIILD